MRLVFVFLLFSYSLFGQKTYLESFDNCVLNAGTRVKGATNCDCGVENEGLLLEDPSIVVEFSQDEIGPILDGDFTLDFHFKMTPSNARMDIFSIADNDQFNNIFTIKYEPTDNSIVTQLSNTIADLKTVKFALPTTFCWVRYTLTRRGRSYALYHDNVLVEAWEPKENYKFSDTAPIAVGNGSTLGQFEVRFNGMIDEFNVYPRALSSQELKGNAPQADKIITRDTTIISGNTVEIETGTICSNSFYWNNQSTLDDDTSKNPIARPEETTEYVLSVRDKTCFTQDTLKVYVVDQNDLDCQKILLPKAFTPNNDGLNDTYGVSNTFLVEQVKSFRIYDRWHKLLWKANDKNAQWDGTVNGTLVNSGTYLYKINYTCSGKEYSKVDNFVILR